MMTPTPKPVAASPVTSKRLYKMQTVGSERNVRPGDWYVQFEDGSALYYDRATFETLYVW